MTQFCKPTTPVESCTHPQAQHRHGTYTAWVTCRCRCTECVAVASAYRAWETKQRLYRESNPGNERFRAFVDVTPAREHIAKLRAAGLGTKEIARRAGVAASVIGAIVWETPSRGRGQRLSVARDTRAKILALEIPKPEQLSPGRCVPARPSTNRVRALHHLGYSQNHIAQLAGVEVQRIRSLAQEARTSTTADTHTRIAKLFAQRWHVTYDPTEQHQKTSATRARNLAKKNKWPHPIDIDENGYLDSDDQTALEYIEQAG